MVLLYFEGIFDQFITISLVVACAHTLSGGRRLETQNFECRTGVDGARIMW